MEELNEAVKNFEDGAYRLYDTLAEFIEKHQGEKGYIDTSNPEGDYRTIFFLDYDDDIPVEKVINAIRAKDGEIEIITMFVNSSYGRDTDEWESLGRGYYNMISNIAWCIEDYVENK